MEEGKEMSSVEVRGVNPENRIKDEDMILDDIEGYPAEQGQDQRPVDAQEEQAKIYNLGEKRKKIAEQVKAKLKERTEDVPKGIEPQRPKFKNRQEEKEYDYNQVASRLTPIQLYAEIKSQKEFLKYLDDLVPDRVLQIRDSHSEFTAFLEKYMKEHLT